jgi:hypothetical protein
MYAWEAARIARGHAKKGRAGEEAHPEDSCHRCGRSLGIPWVAPSPLWNAVMRGGSINNDDEFDGIVCPTCFAQLAQERGVAELWRFHAERILVPLETVTPSGRVWDEQTWMWREPAELAAGRLDRVWWLHRCVPGNPALTWFSDLVAADVPRPERCPSCGTAANEGWFNVANTE